MNYELSKSKIEAAKVRKAKRAAKARHEKWSEAAKRGMPICSDGYVCPVKDCFDTAIHTHGGKQSLRKKKKSQSLSKLKKALWTEISLLVRSWSPKCLACGSPTQVAAHIVPSNEGAMTRYFLPNLYPSCVLCNGLEKWNRGSWVKKHEDMFGVDYVTALYLMAQDTFQIKKWWVLEQTERMRRLRGNHSV